PPASGSRVCPACPCRPPSNRGSPSGNPPPPSSVACRRRSAPHRRDARRSPAGRASCASRQFSQQFPGGEPVLECLLSVNGDHGNLFVVEFLQRGVCVDVDLLVLERTAPPRPLDLLLRVFAQVAPAPRVQRHYHRRSLRFR